MIIALPGMVLGALIFFLGLDDQEVKPMILGIIIFFAGAALL